MISDEGRNEISCVAPGLWAVFRFCLPGTRLGGSVAPITASLLLDGDGWHTANDITVPGSDRPRESRGYPLPPIQHPFIQLIIQPPIKPLIERAGYP